MSLLLAIESSSNVYHVVLGRDGEAIFDSAVDSCNVSHRTLSALLECGLEAVGAQAKEIEGIALNVGPGSLTFVRAGISFVNALAFSLNAKIYPFNWFEIIAEQTREMTELPLVCAVPASNDNAYVGLIRGASVEIMRFGRVHEALAKVSDGLGEVAVAGRIRHRLAALLGEAGVVDLGIENPEARTLLKLGYKAWRDGDRLTTQVEALNDQSDVFFE
ncbi:MAG TPA: tRNA (adenosine(37)-N6)-threonylcarbamoyltransferase complex dimerization subunit type 1 TsaB [Pyrinomonadaceae bacterium]|nr:tRNA (adenosine(37)-N6)-threonylcarbamoyltransferase complex dimerization subunit type 1 TsaB [Pyrinomonadaceae bacterium]